MTIFDNNDKIWNEINNNIVEQLEEYIINDEEIWYIRYYIMRDILTRIYNDFKPIDKNAKYDIEYLTKIFNENKIEFGEVKTIEKVGDFLKIPHIDIYINGNIQTYAQNNRKENITIKI